MYDLCSTSSTSMTHALQDVCSDLTCREGESTCVLGGGIMPVKQVACTVTQAHLIAYFTEYTSFVEPHVDQTLEQSHLL